MLHENDDLRNLLRENDIFVLDRGQRKQLSAAESNYSGSVNLVRWVVEAVHGIVGQKYKLLFYQLDNRLIPRVGVYCKIACFLTNKFGRRIVSSVLTSDSVLNLLEYQSAEENSLVQEVETGR